MKVVRAIVPPVVVVIVILLAWEVAILAIRPPQYLVPGPLDVLAAMREHWSALCGGLWLTGMTAVLGFAISAVLGVVLGSILSAHGFLLRGFYPFATLLQMVPLVAIAPLILIWCGPGQRSSVTCAVIVSVFPVLAATLDGLRSTDRNLVEMFNVLGATRAQRWWKLELPAAVPSIVTGLRIAAGLAVIGTIVGEFVGAFVDDDAPLGIQIMSANREYRTDLVFAAVGLSALVGFALFGAVSAGGWLLLRRWHDSAR